MPRPALPPTPLSSAEIPVKPDAQAQMPSDNEFELPPPAVVQYQPAAMDIVVDQALISPGSSPESANGRRRSAVSKPASAGATFVLPPPPTRSRKIIQMKPAVGEDKKQQLKITPAKASNKGKDVESGNKRKQPSATSAAGRKIARKTAHSLIERRRRSKMNEEFGVLKDMIPACNGQEMHKLAILQASIEYLRYLERCIKDLKGSSDNGHLQGPLVQNQAPDLEMEDSSSDSSASYPNSADGRQYRQEMAFSSPVSPAILPQSGSIDGDVDREATEALLMLNSDRRGSRTRGLSVRDLLST
ncbi:MAG: hypothetical protein M1814_006299 [Vezdaea aestivalis]|nr:MAG: hypothetical protein M1814_006299 [Vezdaea aestivalis]